jgi:cobalamin biosynthesis protein CobT
MAAKNITAYPRVFRYADAYLPKTVTKVEEMLDGVAVGQIEERLYLTEEEQQLVSFVKSNVKERRRKHIEDVKHLEDVDDLHTRIYALEEKVRVLEQKCKMLERMSTKSRVAEDDEAKDDDGGDDDDDDDEDDDDGDDDEDVDDGSDDDSSDDIGDSGNGKSGQQEQEKKKEEKKKNEDREQGNVEEEEKHEEQTQVTTSVKRKLFAIDVDSEYNELVKGKERYILFTECAEHSKVQGEEKNVIEYFLSKPLTS